MRKQMSLTVISYKKQSAFIKDILISVVIARIIKEYNFVV